MAKNTPGGRLTKRRPLEGNYLLLVEPPVEPNQPVKLLTEIPIRTWSQPAPALGLTLERNLPPRRVTRSSGQVNNPPRGSLPHFCEEGPPLGIMAL